MVPEPQNNTPIGETVTARYVPLFQADTQLLAGQLDHVLQETRLVLGQLLVILDKTLLVIVGSRGHDEVPLQSSLPRLVQLILCSP